MNLYELTVVLPEAATASKKKSAEAMIEKLAKVNGGKIEKFEDWGLIDLAYPIKKNNSGVFMHFKLQLDPKGAAELGQKVRLEDTFMRHLLVKSKVVKKGSASV